MYRKIYQKMLEWKQRSGGNTALIIEGARRVGKSYIAEEFAKKEYRSYILIDFAQVGKEIRDVFENQLADLDSFFRYLSGFYGVKLYPNESVFIFDEVQKFPRARESIKFLVADGRYHYIETGSLVSIRKNVKDIQIPSEERHMKMYPMDFEEFLIALGNESLMDFVKDRYANQAEMGQAMHRKAMNYFRQYMIVGGMPQAVAEYVATDDFDRTDEVKRDILELYRSDIAKHANGSTMKVMQIFDEIPSALSRHERKFRLSALERGAKYRDYEDAFFWLADAMIVNHCYNTREPNLGLRMNRDRVTLKCYMADTGLLISHSFDENGIVNEEIYKKILFDKLEVNLGMLTENVVAQMLVAGGHKLYFYANASRQDADLRMEIDFLIAKSTVSNRHNISPIEVKSGKRYTLSSIRKFVRKYASQTDTPYVMHTKDLKRENGMLFLPIYMVGVM
ncbi:MAG: ATP-binding protein [Lachnospiraceae bacterium]|nr:ATP-binding protein [Lachnospiraceae bacterium]